jgi:hypothetical protein
MKRTFSILMVIILMAVVVSTPRAAVSAAQADPSGWAVESVNKAKASDLATAELLNDFGGTTTRLEFCQAAINLLRKYGYEVDAVTPKLFSDTSDKDIGIAAALGITSGTDSVNNLFSPNEPLTREQAATLLDNTFKVIGVSVSSQTIAWTDAAQISAWAAEAVSNLYNAGVISGMDATKLVFSPKTAYTHEQSIVTMLTAYEFLTSEKTSNTFANLPGTFVSLENAVEASDLPKPEEFARGDDYSFSLKGYLSNDAVIMFNGKGDGYGTISYTLSVGGKMVYEGEVEYGINGVFLIDLDKKDAYNELVVSSNGVNGYQSVDVFRLKNELLQYIGSFDGSFGFFVNKEGIVVDGDNSIDIMKPKIARGYYEVSESEIKHIALPYQDLIIGKTFSFPSDFVTNMSWWVPTNSPQSDYHPGDFSLGQELNVSAGTKYTIVKELDSIEQAFYIQLEDGRTGQLTLRFHP